MVGSHVRLLGPIEYESDERTRADLQARHALLLVYLALEAPASHDRDALAARFCPEYSHSRAAAWLRQALAALSEWAQPSTAGRGAPGWAGTSGLLQPDIATTGWLRITRHAVSVDPTRLAVDALQLMQIHQCITGHRHRQIAGCPVCLPRLAEAAALVRGVPLTGLDAAGNDALEHWIQARRAQFSDMARDIFAALVDTRVRMGDHARAIEDARRWLKLEPTSEAVHRLLITALAHRGSRGAALQHVDWFRQLVHSRLGFELEPATLELERRIREGRLVAPPPRPAPDSRITDPAHTALRDQVVALVNESGQRLVSIARSPSKRVFAPRSARPRFQRTSISPRPVPSSQTRFCSAVRSLHGVSSSVPPGQRRAASAWAATAVSSRRSQRGMSRKVPSTPSAPLRSESCGAVTSLSGSTP